MRIRRTLVALALAVAAQEAAAQSACLDPATPLLTLAASYNRWPAPPPGRLGDEAFQRAQTYFETRRDGDYREARLAYENLQRDHPRDLHVKLVLGVLYVAGDDMNYEGADGYRHVALQTFSNADTRAGRLLQEVVELDSAQWLAAVALTRIALVTIEKERIAQAVEVVRRGLGADPKLIPLRLAWHDLLIRQGQYEEAVAYAAANAGDCAAQRHARAEALMLAGDTAFGSRLYLYALEHAQPDELDRFYDDVRVMLTVGQSKVHRALPAAEKPAWLLAYWHRTAVASGRTVETRVTEQMQRAAYADAHFRARYFHGRRADDRLAIISDTSHVVPWDAAGVYYVRHGPPTLRYHAAGNPEHEAWAYTAMQPPVIVLMSRQTVPPGDWTPLYFPPCPFNTRRIVPEDVRERIRTGRDMRLSDIYFALAPLDEKFAEVMQECQFVSMGMKRIRYEELVVQFTYDNRSILPALAGSESSLPHFRKPVRLAVNAYQFRGDDGRPEIVALSSIPVIDLHDDTSRSRRLRMTFAVTDSTTNWFRTDTAVALPSPSDEGLVRIPIVWRNPSITRGTLRVTAVDPADTLRGATHSMAFDVREESAGVALSDIVIADVGVAGSVRRGTYRLSPIPEHRVRADDTFRVFFELYGVTAGDSIETSINLSRMDQKTILELLRLAGRREEKTVSFTEPAEVDHRGVAIRDVELGGDLVPGTYTITVTVTTAAGAVVTREGTLIVDAAE